MGARYAYVYAYIHGFLSGPHSRKGAELAKMFQQQGKTLHQPNCNDTSGAPMGLSVAMPYLKQYLEEKRNQIEDNGVRISSSSGMSGCSSAVENLKFRLIGSSFGGYEAARYAQLFPDDVDSLILLCPAFKYLPLFEHVFGKKNWETWQQQTIKLPATVRPDGAAANVDGPPYMVDVPFSVLEPDMGNPDYPVVQCTTHIIHGKDDKVVPLQTSLDYIEHWRSHGNTGDQSCDVTIDVVDDVHDLVKPATLDILRSAVNRMWLTDV